MKIPASILFTVILIFTFFWQSNGFTEEVAEDSLRKLSVSLDSKDETVAAAMRALEKTLTSLRSGKKLPPTIHNKNDSPYVLYGDLFKTGQLCALTEIKEGPIGIGFSIWDGKKWKTRNLWRIKPEWRPKGWKKPEEDYLPITPSEAPFKLMDLGNKGIPVAILYGGVWKYWQEHFIVCLSSKNQTLEIVQESMHEPVYSRGWVILPYDSGHRSVYQGWHFLRWKNNKLSELARWQNGCNKHENDERFLDGQLIKAMHLTDEGIKEEYVIKNFTQGIDDRSINYFVTLNKKSFGIVSIRWNKLFLDQRERSKLVNDFLFEKFTGLPRRLNPDPDGSKGDTRLESFATIEIKSSSGSSGSARDN